jgi:uncharacterized protein (TIGR02246 family)
MTRTHCTLHGHSVVVNRLLQNCGSHGVPLARALARQCQCHLTPKGRHWRAKALASGTEYHPFATDGLVGRDVGELSRVALAEPRLSHPTFVVCLLLTTLAFVFVGTAHASPPQPAAAAQTRAANPEEEAIQQSARDFEAAYRAKNADAIAAGFTENGEVVDTQGHAVRGRAVIAEEFRRVFQEHPDARMTISIQSIRFPAPGVAIEDGTTTVVRSQTEPPMHDRYAAVQVKVDGRWLVASTRDLVPNTTVIPIPERLKALEFLIGDWVDESPEVMVSASYRWGEGRQFIMHEFMVKRVGQALLKGTQRIGWDPLQHTIMSWTFDSKGGHSQSTWTWDRNHWLVKMHGVSADSQPSSATAFLTPLNHDAYRWESTDRVIGGEASPDTTVTIVRKPPAPQAEATAPPKR